MTARTKVACVGNSITYGFLVDDREQNCYPAQLARMLGPDYEVMNFGHSGTTLLRHGHRPYISTPEYTAALEFNPDIAVIHLGINDTDPRDWPHYGDEFVKDYTELIESFRARNPKIRILIARLTPLGAGHFRFKSGTRDWRLLIQQEIERVSAATGAELIDFDAPLRDRQNLLPEGIHPNAEGAGILAATVYSGITGDYGGLSMAPVYQSGMVLQRDRPLTLRGKANAGSHVTVSLDGQTYVAVTDNRGDWSVTVRPLVTGRVYDMQVTDGRDSLYFQNILAGEVWLASGQSNMALFLRDAVGGTTDVKADTMLRIYDMKPVALTYAQQWSDSIIALVDRNRYFHPAQWESITPDNAAEFSAVAYYFGRMLRDSLDIPVGIISNSVGGATTESWIDVNTLELGLPEILVNWRSNDYVQPWAQQRATENTGTDGTHRHPFEPSYLFSAGIRPLTGYPIAGTIWYQGESNAHNTEIHETLFPLLIRSFRNEFGESMPMCFVQLSSLNRPSWPLFRDSQRRLAGQIPGTYMAVSSDVGNPSDVHPLRKRPVGERLARLALHHIYGYTSLTPAGPEPVGARAHDGTIIVTMANSNGMQGHNGETLRTFEVAAADGLYRPAVAEIISDSEIKVYNMDIKKPRYVRYGWEPYSTGNLENSDALPATTFRMEVDNAADYDPEPGMECGISAPYAGMLAGRLITAGGCNFPVNPMAADSRKKYYRGIYAADPSSMKWERIGSLPEGMAYGASVTTDDGILLIGGATENGATTDVRMLTVSGGSARLIAYPALPYPVDNMAACAIDNKVYVAGGNADGAPSRQLLMLDLHADMPSWKSLRSMPGNPRVQPVMTAGKTASGETCLYLWGGFAPRHNGNEPTLETAGLRYSPKKDKWYPLPAPTTDDGEPISLGGGTACTLTNGTIAACGGVNKDIFLDALRNQAPDYLQHPTPWYRFNGRVLHFHPASETWNAFEPDPAAARAGAAMIAGPDNDFFLTGGELKPRIRTAETLHIRYTANEL